MDRDDLWIVYLLDAPRYYGTVRVLRQQTCEAAAQWRLRKHRSDKKMCLRALSSRTCVVWWSARMEESEALLWEALYTIVEWSYNEDIRGGPYCHATLMPEDKAELKKLGDLVCKLPTPPDVLEARKPGARSCLELMGLGSLS